MPEPTSPTPHPVHASEVEDSLDRRIASLRRSLEGDASGRDGSVRDEARRAKRDRFVGLAGTFRRASRLLRAHRVEIRVYAFAVAVSLVVGWLISSHLNP